jgi:myo-inositol-1(or 4)-monophosphatase
MIMSAKELLVAVEAAMTAGKDLMRYYGRAKASLKDDTSFVTEADIESEKRIRTILEREFPSYSFLGEESGLHEAESGRLWVVDPLDGTTNFVMMNPFFDISIALIQGEEPVLGVVHYPFLNETFCAEMGKGAFLNGKKVHVSSDTVLGDSIITFCHGRDKESTRRISRIFTNLKSITNKVRQLGAAALELCYVACGRTSCFLMPGMSSWDVLAGAIMVKEAGGMISDFDGHTLSVDSKDLLASNGKIHSQLLRVLGRV